jgi:CheY-like chemotaxis protein
MSTVSSGPWSASASALPERRGRVLVIDDEPLIRKVIERTLSIVAQVTLAADGAVALDLLRAGERFDLVLCDVVMPVMDGVEFHQRLSAELPDEAPRLVFMTGGLVSARAQTFFRHARHVVLEKPLDLNVLQALVLSRVSGEPAWPVAASDA